MYGRETENLSAGAVTLWARASFVLVSKNEFGVRKCVCMKRKICGALAFVLLLFSCLGALAEDLQFDSSCEVADYLEQAGKNLRKRKAQAPTISS